jgi:protein TonB
VAGRLLQRVDPVYPELARRAHIGGTVVLNAVIRPDGKVGSVEVASGNPLLARAAADAVRQWRYEPFRLNGSAVQAAATIRLNFNPNLGPQSGH